MASRRVSSRSIASSARSSLSTDLLRAVARRLLLGWGIEFLQRADHAIQVLLDPFVHLDHPEVPVRAGLREQLSSLFQLLPVNRQKLGAGEEVRASEARVRVWTL